VTLRSFLRPLKWPWRWVFDQRDRKDYLAQWTSWAIAALAGHRSMVKSTWPGKHTLDGQKHVAILVTYDTRGQIHDFLIDHMKALHAAGRAVILVSNSPKFSDNDARRAAEHCALVVWRKNRGYDFGAYRDGIQLVPEYDALDSLIVLNDSVYGPFQALPPVLKRMDAAKADIWGMTDSWDAKWHLQSYFLLFHKTALQSDFVKQLWDNWIHVQSKSWVIRNLEVGLTSRFEKAGLRCASAWQYRALVTKFAATIRDKGILDNKDLPKSHRKLLEHMLHFADAGAPMNPCHFFWDEMILDGFPFLKREVLTSNPIGMPRLYEWNEVVENVSDYPTDHIVRHLRTIMKNRVI